MGDKVTTSGYCGLSNGNSLKLKVKIENDALLIMLDYLNLDYDIFGLLHDIPASCFLSFLISFISSDT